MDGWMEGWMDRLDEDTKDHDVLRGTDINLNAREKECYVDTCGRQNIMSDGWVARWFDRRAIFGSHHADDDRGSNSIPVILVLQMLKNTVSDVQYGPKSGRIRQELALLVSKST
jgi:hypothetical protein